MAPPHFTPLIGITAAIARWSLVHDGWMDGMDSMDGFDRWFQWMVSMDSMDGFDGWIQWMMDGFHGCMDGFHGWMDGFHGWMDEFHGWMDSMDGFDGWMDGWVQGNLFPMYITSHNA